jgi:hypothetical protein
MAALFFRDSEGGAKSPILDIAHFEDGRWLDDANMVIRSFYGDELQCYAWAELPPADGKPMVLEAAEEPVNPSVNDDTDDVEDAS